MATEELNSLSLGDIGAPLYCKVHPLVPISIMNLYMRRPEESGKIVGTLLGTVESNVVEIKNCFSIPHDEKDGHILFDQQAHEELTRLHMNANSKEIVVGFFETTSGLNEFTCMLHNFYSSQFKPSINTAILTTPLCLKMDLSLETGKIDMSVSMAKGAYSGFVLFQELPFSLMTEDPQSVGLDMILGSTSGVSYTYDDLISDQNIPANMDSLETALENITKALTVCETYIDDVLQKKKEPNYAFARLVSEALSTTNLFNLSNFEAVFNDNLQDILMVIYLSNLIKAQILLTEKLNKIIK
mmetsp:Transcript_12048/g.13198  ORF Transcript_12048/g.13198 Transcript_12048/m.13198 type:complete len:300 (+) Transcript_12048:196-1095(+)